MSFLFLKSDHKRFCLVVILVSSLLSLDSNLMISIKIPPKSISVIGGELIIPMNFNIAARTANNMSPHATIPSIFSKISLFIILSS